MSENQESSQKGRKPSHMTIGEKLKALRKAQGHNSYRSFAKAHGLDPKQYWRLEEDESDCRVSSIKRLADIHGLSLEAFFRGVG